MPSETLLRAIFDGAPDGMLLADDSGRYVAANAAGCLVLGRPRAEIIGTTIERYMADGSEVYADRWAAFHALSEVAGRVNIRHPDGSLRYVDFSARANVLPGLHLSILRDVTQAVELERREKLVHTFRKMLGVSFERASTERALALVCSELAFDTAELWIEDLAARELTRVATAVAGPPGLEAPLPRAVPLGAGLPGQTWATGVSSVSLEPPRASLAVAVTSGGTVSGTLVMKWRATTADLPESRIGLLETIAAVLGEHAERGHLALALNRSRAQLDIVLRHVSDAVVAIDPAGTILYASESAARMLAMMGASAATTDQEIASRVLVLDEDGQEVPYDALPPRVAARGEAVRDVLLSLRLHASGSILHLRVSSSPVLEDDGCVAFTITTARDVTDELAAAAATDAANDARSFARALSDAADAERTRIADELHDSIGQTLALVKLALERGAADGASGRADALARIDDAIRQIRTTTFEVHPAMLDDLGLVPTLERYAELLRPSAALPIAITETGHRRPLGPSTARVLFRAAKELATNALKHAAAREVLISVHWSAHTVRLVVDDDGIGFAPGDARGGLLAVRERAAGHGGAFIVETQHGAGTRAIVELPIVEAR